MKQLTMKSVDLTQKNIDKIAELFPNVITEARDENGKLIRAIDFDLLKQELSDVLVEGEKERYQLTWPGKKQAILNANTPIDKTLRPVKEDSVDWDSTQNLYIEGDNLEVLKLLQESYLNKIKCIYIDPPYNTGNDFIYKDDFRSPQIEYLEDSGQVDEDKNRLITNPVTNGRFHSDWLTMIYSRLKIARNLLSDDGIIFISIDDSEIDNLRKVCDEIFGQDNFVTQLIWKKKYGGGAKTKYYVELHEYIICYAKNKETISNIEIPYNEDLIKKYYKYKDEKFETRGPYRLQPLATNSNDERPNLRYPIIYNGIEIWPEKQWQWSRERTETALLNNELVFNEHNGRISVNFKQYLKDESGEMRTTKPFTIIEGVYTQHGTNEISEIFGDGKIFPFPKPSSLIKELILPFVKENDIVLDFFSGSGSTAHAVMQHNVDREDNIRFILIQLQEETPEGSEAYKAGYKNICEIGKERIRRAAKKIKEETGADIDYGFRVFRVDSSNMKDVYYTPDNLKQGDLFDLTSNIKEDRTGEDLLIQVMLELGLELSLPMETKQMEGKTVHYVAGNSLIACFDDNVPESVIKQIAAEQPLRVVFRDSSFEDDSARINVEELFKMLSPGTEIQVL
ncbi:site-specific DNA-methyltransferase [Brevibacillus gelatini]|uniref:site-specific DNA-methyltransferase n=1 Tax=Brevibacillus gelatini TaxID=1655277 RepID=UPI003D8150D0